MDISIEELTNLIHYKPKSDTTVPAQPKNIGQHIVVLDRGFVYVGTVHELTDRVVITDAKNIRRWGTTDGLGQLRNGPLAETKTDTVGEVVAYRHSVQHLIPCKGF